jgi:hypothetical protein
MYKYKNKNIFKWFNIRIKQHVTMFLPFNTMHKFDCEELESAVFR